MTSPADPFASSYAQARLQFLAAAAAAGARVDTCSEPRHDGAPQALAMDIARLGADAAPAVLIVSSGCHGVEGHAGSGIQVALLQDASVLARAHAAGVALLFVHALNPWGFANGRRVTQEGVDLNRNCVDFTRPLPRNPGYDALAGQLLPTDWPPSPANEAALMAYAAAHGAAALQQAVSSGQYTHPDGLFYGGRAPTWSQATLRQCLRRHATRCRRLGWIDLHSGLGESGAGERIYAGRPDAATHRRAVAWWGTGLTSTGDGSSSSADLQGNLWRIVEDECPQAEYTGITLELGTQALAQVIQALRFDHWVARRADADDAQRAQARQLMRDAFFTDTPDWKRSAVAHGRAVTLQAIEGLARAGPEDGGTDAAQDVLN